MPDVWMLHAATLIAGIVVLGMGGEFLVRGATRLARSLGVSTLVVGLTVVAFGTSAPEAAVTIFAAARGAGELAIGNIVGSNIANVLLIMGAAAVMAPLAVSRSLIRVDGPVMILAAAALIGLAAPTGAIGRWAGVGLVGALVIYTAVTYILARRNYVAVAGEDEAPSAGWARFPAYNALLVAVGIGGLVLGASLMVDGATGLALLFSVSEHVIGLTIVAIGTSLPELATAVIAARRNHPDIAIGNVIGSNIFNVLFVAGATAIVQPLSVPPSILRFDGPLMVTVCIIAYVAVYTGRRVTRLEGSVLLFFYAAYLVGTTVRAL
jgi:cation:H+ antiporter